MSLSRYLVSPPLAIAIAPAKPHPPPRTEKKSDPQDNDKVKGKAEEEKVEGPAPDPKAKVKPDQAEPKADKGDPDPAKPDAEADGVVKFKVDKANNLDAEAMVQPDTPGSMVPEPPTPADGVNIGADPQATPTPNTPLVEVKDKSDDNKPAVNPAVIDTKDNPKANQSDTPQPDKADTEPFIGPLPKPIGPEPEPELEPEPLRLIGPPPKYPIRTKLELNPSHPWPPIESDPRGAYHLYAKGCHKGIIESVYIDVTKDGWMSEHWKEKSERDALEKLRGEDLRKARRDLEWQGKLREGRKVPKSAGDVLLCLWNLLVQAPNNELPTETFWSSFDWTDPAAQVHTKQIAVEDMNENKSVTVDGEEVEWTKDGVEQILATVGIQCVYNSDTPIGRRYTDRYPGAFSQDRAFIILGHSHFMLRLREWLEFKPEDTVGKFEVLVVSGHDRILGEMVREKRMVERKREEAEYYKRKKAQKEVAEAEAKAKAEAEDKGEKGKEEDEEGGKKADSDTSTKKVKDGKEVEKAINVDDNDKPKDNEKVEGEDEGKVEEGKLMVAIPVKTDGLKGGDIDVKHDQIAILAGPGEAKAAEAAKPEGESEVKGDAKDEKNGGKKVEEKGKEVRDPMKDAEKIAKMMGNKGELKIEDIQIAMKVLEAASDKESKKNPEKDEIGLIWTWGESCERWRWANWEAGVHDVGLGGWEERDWKVFADDRGVEEFEDDMGMAEGLEEDLHDWSC